MFIPILGEHAKRLACRKRLLNAFCVNSLHQDSTPMSKKCGTPDFFRGLLKNYNA